MSKDRPRCETCHWWDGGYANAAAAARDDRLGRCRAGTPKPGPVGLGGWPITKPDDWCGQHSELPGRTQIIEAAPSRSETTTTKKDSWGRTLSITKVESIVTPLDEGKP